MALEIGTSPMGIDKIAERLAAAFAGDLEDVRVEEPDTVVARCDKAVLKDIARRLRAQVEIGYETLNWIAGVDHARCLESVYHLYSWKTNTYLQMHVELASVDAEVDTVSDVWPSAEWLEREAWDMFGIRFVGHPDLRRILLRDDFIGHPLRKDYIDLVENHPHV